MKQGRRLGQFSLLTLLLLAMASAVWIGDWRVRKRIAAYEAELPALRNLSRELTVGDPELVSVVSPYASWPDEYRWDLYIPAETAYRLNLQLREIDSGDLGTPLESVNISPGTHQVELKYFEQDEQWPVKVLIDEKIVISTTMPAHWNLGRGSSGGNQVSQLQSDLDGPIKLFRRRFMVPTNSRESVVPDGKCDGVLLWLSPE